MTNIFFTGVDISERTSKLRNSDMQVMNIDSNRQRNQRPAFGTSGRILNKLPNKLLAQHQDVAPVLEGLENGLAQLRQNGHLNDLTVTIQQVKVKGREFIKMACELLGADKKGLSREVISSRGIDLFEYIPKNQTVEPAIGLTDVVKEIQSKATGMKAFFIEDTVAKESIKENAKDILPTYYKNALNVAPGNKIKETGLDPLWKKHIQASEMFEMLDNAIVELKEIPHSGLLKMNYQLRPLKKGLSELVLHMDLVSATKPGVFSRVHEGTDIPLFLVDKDKKIVESPGELLLINNKKQDQVIDSIMSRYNLIKESVNGQINKLPTNK